MPHNQPPRQRSRPAEFEQNYTLNLNFELSKTAERKLEIWVEELMLWARSHNLISAGQVREIWSRHVKESLQFAALIPDSSKHIIDVGTGAGFPAMGIASMLDSRRTGGEVICIEPRYKKYQFLRHATRCSGLPILPQNLRAEDFSPTNAAEVITCRAVGSLTQLVKMTRHLFTQETIGMWLKGENIDSELATFAASPMHREFEARAERIAPNSQTHVVRIFKRGN